MFWYFVIKEETQRKLTALLWDSDRKNKIHMTEKTLKIDKGWLTNTRKVVSPHFDLRPDPQDISLLIIHYISLPPEQFGSSDIDDFFQGKLDPHRHPYFAEISTLRVSAHCLINRAGEITQYVNFNDRAWHAGVSCFEGREKCNDFAIGIELEGSNAQPFTTQQYASLQRLTQAIMQAYPLITKERIVGHCDVSPGGKSTQDNILIGRDIYRRFSLAQD